MATLVVATQAQLETAIRNVKSGDTILLKAGTYEDLNVTHSSTRNYKFTETVTIKSEDPNNRAVVNELFLLGVKNVVISDVDFDYTGVQGATTQSWQLGQPFYMENVTGVTLDRLSIDGHQVNGYGTGTGLRIKGSTDVTVSNVEMNDFKIAMNVATSSNVTIKDNALTDMSQDGLYLGAVKGILIEDNYIGDFNSATPTNPVSKDGIQFYTNSTTAASEGVTIRGNTFESESLRQNITILNEAYKAGDLSTYHRDILIEDNYIRSANTQGVTVAHSDGVIIRNNTVAYDSNQIVTQIPLINVSTTSRNVTVSDNTIYGVDDSPGAATTITVGTQAELLAALASVRGGDTILLEAGTYEDLNLTHSSVRNYKFTETVTIKSEDPNHRAVVNELFIFGAQNLVISDIDFDYTGAQASNTLAWQVGLPFYVESASNITLDRLDFDGHRINGFGAATGLRVKNSSDITVANTEMTDFKIAMNISGGSGFTIRDNDIKQMSQDGLYLGGLKNVLIEDNYFGDYLSANPSDPLGKESIQFYTNGTTAPSEGVTIRGNTFSSEDYRQNILIFNELYRDGDSSAYHRNILIEDNYIRSAYTQGITVTHGDGVVIRNNTVAYDSNQIVNQIPLIDVSPSSRNVDVGENTVYGVDAGHENATVFLVANQAELQTALVNVRGGDTILLKAGTYADLNLTHSSSRNYKFTEQVTIKSADPTHQAVVNELFIRGATNIKISDLKFDYTGVQGADTQSWQVGDPFFIENAAGVTLERLLIDGHSNSAGFGAGTGLRVKNSSDVTVSHTEMVNFKVAMNFWNSSQVTIEDNVIRKMNHDALFIGGAKNLVIEDNYIGDYNPQYPLALHKDGIQVFTDSVTGPLENVVIRGNTFESGDVRHGVFIFNELYRDGNAAAYHRNILIEDNYIRNSNTHGITVTHGDGVTVRNNTVTLNPDQGITQIPLVNVSGTSRNVEIIGNTVSSVQDSLGDTWTVYGNEVEARSRFHWDGVYVNGVLQPQVRPTAQDPSLSDHFVIDRSAFNGTTPLVVLDIDFAEGDRLQLTGFNAGTFIRPTWDKTFEIWNNGGAAELNSFSDLDKVEDSVPVSASITADGDALIVINQGSAGTFYLLLDNIVGMPDGII